jgi:hypothetical protein
VPPARSALLILLILLSRQRNPPSRTLAGTPPNAIAFSTRYLRISDMVRAGVLLNALAVGVLFLIIRFYWPLLGLKWW